MGWSGNFKNALKSGSISPEFRLEFLEIPNSVGTSAIVKSTSGRLRIADYGIRIDGTGVTPQTWSVSFGGFSCQLSGDIRQITPWVRRGQFAVLECRIGSGWERLAIGQLITITGRLTTWTLRFRDLLSAFQNTTRSSATSTANFFELFWYAGYRTTLSGNWSTSDTTMNILNGDKFDAPSTGHGLIKCWQNPSTHPDDFFFLKFTGSTTSTLTGVASVTWPLGSDTTQPLTSANSEIMYTPFLEGVPWVLIGRIINSTGLGTNGPLDVFPSSWSVGGGFIDIFDFDDARTTRNVIKRSDGSSDYSWAFQIESPLPGGIRDYLDISINSGQWPVQRQGSISWRGCTDPTGREMNYQPPVVAHLRDRDIQEIIEHDLYNSSIQTIYVNSVIEYTGSSTYGADPYRATATNYSFATLPAQDTITRNMQNRYNPDISGLDKRSFMAGGDLARMRAWDLYPSERLRIRVNLEFAVLCAGDVVEISSDYLSSIYSPIGDNFSRQRGMVLRTFTDFSSPSVVLEIGIASGRVL